MYAPFKVFNNLQANTTARMTWAIALLALSPAPILVDHGHFQYNGISLGCVAGAAAAVVSVGRNGRASRVALFRP